MKSSVDFHTGSEDGDLRLWTRLLFLPFVLILLLSVLFPSVSASSFNYRYTTDIHSLKWMKQCQCTPAFQSKINYVNRFGGWIGGGNVFVNSTLIPAEPVILSEPNPEPKPEPFPVPYPTPLPKTCTLMKCRRN